MGRKPTFQKKIKGRHTVSALLYLHVGLSLFHGAQATGTNVDCFAAFQLYFANIGLPGSVGLTVRVRNVLTENNALATDTTLCHF